MLHKTSQERYQKLEAQFHRLMNHFDREGLDDYIQTANSLRDWIPRDPSLNQHQKDEIKRFAVDNSIDWQICHQIANYQKHGGPDSRHKSTFVVRNTQVKPGGSPGVVFPNLETQTFGAGDEILIEYEFDGNRGSVDALAFVFRTFQYFYYIFELAHIIPLVERFKARKTWREILTRDE
jgi:hypothetical protein